MNWNPHRKILKYSRFFHVSPNIKHEVIFGYDNSVRGWIWRVPSLNMFDNFGMWSDKGFKTQREAENDAARAIKVFKDEPAKALKILKEE